MFCSNVKWPSMILSGILFAGVVAGCKGPVTPDVVSSESVTELPLTLTTTERVDEVATVSATPPTTTTTRQMVTNTIPPEVLIEYQQSGGFLGLDDHLTISTDLKATLSRPSEYYEFEIDQRDLEQILQQLDEAEFSKLETEYLPADSCCDLIEYTITYNGHTVQTMDTAVPASLEPVLDTLSQIVETQSKH